MYKGYYTCNICKAQGIAILERVEDLEKKVGYGVHEIKFCQDCASPIKKYVYVQEC